MGSGFRTFAASEVLTSSNVQNYLMDQAVTVHSGTAVLATAIPSPEAGMVAYVDSGDSSEGLYTFTGSAWQRGPGWNAPRGVQLYAVDTVSTRDFTAAATIPNITGSVSVVNGRYYRCLFSCRFLNTTLNAGNSFNMRAGGASVASGIAQNPSTFGDQSITVFGVFRATSTTTLTFDVTAAASTGTLKIYGGNSPTVFTVEDIGPYGAPA